MSGLPDDDEYVVCERCGRAVPVDDVDDNCWCDSCASDAALREGER